jgi:hypothetical protein
VKICGFVDEEQDIVEICAFRSNPAIDSGGMTATRSGAMAAGYSAAMPATQWLQSELVAVMQSE